MSHCPNCHRDLGPLSDDGEKCSPCAEIDNYLKPEIASLRAQLAALRAENERLKQQLEHEFGFEAASDQFAKDAPAWEKLPDMKPDEAFALLCKRALEPSDAAIRLAKFIPLEQQTTGFSNRELWALHKWMTNLRAQLASTEQRLREAEKDAERALSLFASMPEASPHRTRAGIWGVWTDGCNLLRAIAARARQEGGHDHA